MYLYNNLLEIPSTENPKHFVENKTMKLFSKTHNCKPLFSFQHNLTDRTGNYPNGCM